MEITLASIIAIVNLRIRDNLAMEISPEDLRVVLTQMGQWTEQVETNLTALTELANTLMELAEANGRAITGLDGRVTTAEGSIDTISGLVAGLQDELRTIEEDGTEGLTPEEKAAAKLARDTNTSRINSILETIATFRESISTLQSEVGTLQTDVLAARGVANRADGKADIAVASIGQVSERVATNAADLDNHQTQEFEPLATTVGEHTEEIKVAKSGLEDTDEEVARVRAIAEAARDADDITNEDFIEEAGHLDAINPNLRYSGANGDAPTFAEITLPLSGELLDLDVGRTIRMSGGLLFPQFNDQRGSESEFYYVIEQDGNRIAGDGVPSATDPTRQEIERDWVRVDVEQDFTELTIDAHAGSDPVIKMAMIWTGEAGSFTPRLTGFDLHYIGRLREPVAGVVRDVFGRT